MFFNQRNLFGVSVKEALTKGTQPQEYCLKICDHEILVEDLWPINLDTVEKCHRGLFLPKWQPP